MIYCEGVLYQQYDTLAILVCVCASRILVPHFATFFAVCVS